MNNQFSLHNFSLREEKIRSLIFLPDNEILFFGFLSDDKYDFFFLTWCIFFLPDDKIQFSIYFFTWCSLSWLLRLVLLRGALGSSGRKIFFFKWKKNLSKQQYFIWEITIFFNKKNILSKQQYIFYLRNNNIFFQ